MRVKIQIKHFKGELTARDNIGPFTPDPARIVLQMRQKDRIRVSIGLVAGRKPDVDRGIVDFDDLAVCFNRIWNVNWMFEGADQRLSNGGFAIASRSINQDCSPGV